MEVYSIVAEKLWYSDKEITDGLSFSGDLEADSLDMVDIVMECENRFKINIGREEQECICTVGELVDIVTVEVMNKD